MDDKHPLGDNDLNAVSGGSGPFEGDTTEYRCLDCGRTFPKCNASLTIYYNDNGSIRGTKLFCPYCFSDLVRPASWEY